MSSKYRYPDSPPFEDLYEDSLAYFRVLQNQDVEAGLKRFRCKAEETDLRSSGSYPVEIYLRLLAARNRPAEALLFLDSLENPLPASLAGVINELCEMSGDFTMMARLARRREDPLSYLAARLVESPSPPPDV